MAQIRAEHLDLIQDPLSTPRRLEVGRGDTQNSQSCSPPAPRVLIILSYRLIKPSSNPHELTSILERADEPFKAVLMFQVSYTCHLL